jgi:uncharacterized membrane protein YkoI
METMMVKGMTKVAVAVLAASALAVGAAVIADAASNKSSGSQQGAADQSAQRPPGGRNGIPPQRSDETVLTDGTAAKVKAAALKKVPGASVIRVETDAEGSPYEAHLRKSDGSEVTAKVNKQFQVTAVQQGFGGGPRGAGGPGPGAAYGAPGAPSVTG